MTAQLGSEARTSASPFLGRQTVSLPAFLLSCRAIGHDILDFCERELITLGKSVGGEHERMLGGMHWAGDGGGVGCANASNSMG